jgi:hypothetical protein
LSMTTNKELEEMNANESPHTAVQPLFNEEVNLFYLFSLSFYRTPYFVTIFFFFKKKKNIITTTFRTMIGSRYTERVKNVVYHMLMRSVTVSCYFFSVINNLIVKDGCTPL